MQNFLMAMALMTVGLGIFGWALRVCYQSWAAHSWPRTTGRILESGLRDYHEPENYGFTYHVKYQYHAQGMEQTGTRLQFGLGRYMNKEAVEALIARYPVGHEVTVYHHPHRPWAVLEPGCTSPTYFLLMVGGFIVLAGLGILARG